MRLMYLRMSHQINIKRVLDTVEQRAVVITSAVQFMPHLERNLSI